MEISKCHLAKLVDIHWGTEFSLGKKEFAMICDKKPSVIREISNL